MKKIPLTLCLAAALFSTSAFAAKGSWKTLAKSPYVVKTRAIPKTPFHEVWVEGRLAAPAQDVQAALQDLERYPAFMPYTKVSKLLGAPKADGSRLLYSRLDPPVISARDYVVDVEVEKRIAPDGSGEFRQSWSEVQGQVPAVAGVVRLRKNSGFWNVRPLPDGSSVATYSFTSDPGVKLPGFVVHKANRKAMTDLMKAVEKEALRLKASRSSPVARR